MPSFLRRMLMLVALGATLGATHVVHADEPFDPSDRAVFLAPDWRPIASVGYRMQIVREPLRDDVELRSAHGFTVDVLFPLLASGTRSTRTRVALGLGVGADFASARYDPSRPVGDGHMVRGYEERATYLHGQLGVVFRSVLGDRLKLVATLAWLPGARLLRIDVDPPEPSRIMVFNQPPYRAGRFWSESFARGRLSFALHRDALRLGVFFGATFRDEDPFFTRRQELDFGTQIGVGW